MGTYFGAYLHALEFVNEKKDSFDIFDPNSEGKLHVIASLQDIKVDVHMTPSQLAEAIHDWVAKQANKKEVSQ